MKHDIVLRAPGVTLVPLGYEHARDLLALVDDDLWAGLSTPRPRSVADMELAVLRAWETPGRYSFTVTDAVTGEVRGATSLYEVEREHRRAVVGLTFYGRRWWGGPTNPGAKLALLSHAFDTWGLHRVAFRVDPQNLRSIAAVERLGGVAEGVLRGHRTTGDGSPADSMSFSILAHEFSAVRERLERRLAAEGLVAGVDERLPGDSSTGRSATERASTGRPSTERASTGPSQAAVDLLAASLDLAPFEPTGSRDLVGTLS